jgi:aryl-alcohol dehydrogenase-like predicted oxidoreductase
VPRNSSFIYKNKPVDVKEVAERKPPDVTVGTKVRISSADFHRISEAVAKSLEGSLVRLRLDRVDIFHLHNAITETGNGEAISVRQVLNDVLPAFERLRQQATHSRHGDGAEETRLWNSKSSICVSHGHVTNSVRVTSLSRGDERCGVVGPLWPCGRVRVINVVNVLEDRKITLAK